MDSKLQDWKVIFESIKSDRFTDDTKNYQQIINDFLIPDSINPKLFIANADFLEVGMMELYTGKCEPTESIEDYGFITHRPSGFPLWFLAAYPDVATWLSKQYDQDNQVLYKATGKSEDYFKDDNNFVNNRFNHQLLRNIVMYFKSYSNKTLETSKESKFVETIFGSKLADSFIPNELKVDMLINEAKNLRSNSRFREAIQKLNQAIEISQSPIAYYNRGEVYYEIKEYHNSYNDFDKAIKLNSDFKEAYVARGSLRISLFNDKNGAISDLKRAADMGHMGAKKMYEQFFK